MGRRLLPSITISRQLNSYANTARKSKQTHLLNPLTLLPFLPHARDTIVCILLPFHLSLCMQTHYAPIYLCIYLFPPPTRRFPVICCPPSLPHFVLIHLQCLALSSSTCFSPRMLVGQSLVYHPLPIPSISPNPSTIPFLFSILAQTLCASFSLGLLPILLGSFVRAFFPHSLRPRYSSAWLALRG